MAIELNENRPPLSKALVTKVIGLSQSCAHTNNALIFPNSERLIGPFVEKVLQAQKLGDRPASFSREIEAGFVPVFLLLTRFFGPNCQPKFLTHKQKTIVSIAAVLIYAFMAGAKALVQSVFSELKLRLKDFFQLFKIIIEPLTGFEERNDLENALWEAAGQAVGIAQLIIKSTGALAKSLGALGVGLVILEGVTLQYQIETKSSELLALKMLLTMPDSRNEEIIEKVKLVEAEVAELILRRQFVLASFAFAVTAFVLASVFTGGIAPLVIGVSAALVSFSLALAESYFSRAQKEEDKLESTLSSESRPLLSESTEEDAVLGTRHSNS